MYNIFGGISGRVMKKRLTHLSLILFVLIIFPLAAYPAEPNLGQNAGQSRLVTNDRTRSNNNSGKKVNSGLGQNRTLNNKPNNNSTGRNNFCNNNDHSHGRNGHNDVNNNHHQGPHKFNPLYAPFYYFGYYGYAPYTANYAYQDPEYPLGYGTTMGTTLERPSNLEVNQFGQNSPAEGYYPPEDSGAGDTYTDAPQGHVQDNYNSPPAVEQTISIWIDESGVKNYANELNLVPLKYRDVVTTLSAE